MSAVRCDSTEDVQEGGQALHSDLLDVGQLALEATGVPDHSLDALRAGEAVFAAETVQVAAHHSEVDSGQRHGEVVIVLQRRVGGAEVDLLDQFERQERRQRVLGKRELGQGQPNLGLSRFRGFEEAQMLRFEVADREALGPSDLVADVDPQFLSISNPARRWPVGASAQKRQTQRKRHIAKIGLLWGCR